LRIGLGCRRQLLRGNRPGHLGHRHIGDCDDAGRSERAPLNVTRWAWQRGSCLGTCDRRLSMSKTSMPWKTNAMGTMTRRDFCLSLGTGLAIATSPLRAQPSRDSVMAATGLDAYFVPF